MRMAIVAPVGGNGVEELLDIVAESSDKHLPEVARGGDGVELLWS